MFAGSASWKMTVKSIEKEAMVEVSEAPILDRPMT
jgi:hypothetical protein